MIIDEIPAARAVAVTREGMAFSPMAALRMAGLTKIMYAIVIKVVRPAITSILKLVLFLSNSKYSSKPMVSPYGLLKVYYGVYITSIKRLYFDNL
jgi:hypothetical protein